MESCVVVFLPAPHHMSGATMSSSPKIKLIFAICLGVTHFAVAEPNIPGCPCGIVLRGFSPGSSLEAAGLEQGDTLLAWKTIAGMATVGLCSVQDWYSLELQQSPRGPVILWIERKGLTHEITVAPGV